MSQTDDTMIRRLRAVQTAVDNALYTFRMFNDETIRAEALAEVQRLAEGLRELQ